MSIPEFNGEPVPEAFILSVMKNARAAAWAIHNTAPEALPMDEMVSVAYEAVMLASARYPSYCREHGFDLGSESYWRTYALKRVRGHLIDYNRSNDHMSRSGRAKLKKLNLAGEGSGASTPELAARTGLTLTEIHEVRTQNIRKAVMLEDAADDEHPATVSAESAGWSNALLTGMVSQLKSMPAEWQVVIVACYYGEGTIPEVAANEALLEMFPDWSEARVKAIHDNAVAALHAGMMQAASINTRITSADTAHLRDCAFAPEAIAAAPGINGHAVHSRALAGV